uniref:Polysaccharide biosynthesis protein C-terminal domain-containing protein n=1 Tax=Fagus sylvatica TaxID=28930 RepID=A0A2N9F6A4_FAGSY
MAGALETLCGQTFGAKQYHKLGNYTCCAMISLSLVCLPVALLWIFMDKLLIFFGQDPMISLAAGKYCIWLIPSLFAYGILQSLVRVLPVSEPDPSDAYKLVCNSLFAYTSLLAYATCKETQILFTSDAFLSIKEFFHFATPSTIMVCLNTTTLHYYIPYGVGAAVSTRVSNELGAGNPVAAQLAVGAGMVLAVLEAIIVSTALFCCRNVLGYAYSNEEEVVSYVSKMVPLLCLRVSVDSLLGVLSGVARGSGWQQIGAYVNLRAYYLVGIPVAALLGFLLRLRGKGLWIGILTGSIMQAILLAFITAFTNWQIQATKAREIIFEGQLSADNGLA